MLFVVERDAGSFEPPAALDVHRARTIDQNVGDRRIAEQGFQRAEPQGLVDDLVDEPHALILAQQFRAVLAKLFDAPPELSSQFIVVDAADRRHVQTADELLVDLLLQPHKTLFGALGAGRQACWAQIERLKHRSFLNSEDNTPGSSLALRELLRTE